MVNPSESSRRDFLRLAAAAGLLGPAALSCRGSDPVIPKAPPQPDHVGLGLAAMADVHKRGWVAGHFGASVLAAHYFCVDNKLDERTERAIRGHVDSFVAGNREREFPAPRPGPGAADPARIVEKLDGQISDLRSGGHNAIYVSLILRALRDRPEFATPSIVDGICRLLDVFGARSRLIGESEYNIEHPLPAYGGARDLAEATFRAILRPWDHVRAIGASGVIHWVTHAEALVTLEDLGYADTARRGYAAHRLHINGREVEDGGCEPQRDLPDWLGPGYWESDAPKKLFGGSYLAGHAFKLPHSLFRLLRRTDDQMLRNAAMTRAFKLTIPFE